MVILFIMKVRVIILSIIIPALFMNTYFTYCNVAPFVMNILLKYILFIASNSFSFLYYRNILFILWSVYALSQELQKVTRK